MKKLVLTLAILAGFAMQALAYDFQVDGIYYNVSYFSVEPQVWVTHCSQAGYGCYEGDIVIPETVTYEGVTYVVTEIGSDAFRDCVDLTSISIPNSVIQINARAFYGCTALQDIHIPNWIHRIHATAFNNTVWYNDQPDNQPLYLDGWCMGYKGEMPLEALSIEEGTLAVADGAFSEYESLVSVTLSNTLNCLGYYAFSFCSALRHVEFGESVEEIMYQAFYECRSLDTVVLPETISKLGRSAFSNCVSLSHLILPNSITSIGECAFEGCSSLTFVNIPNSLTEIEKEVFDQTGLKTITIPDGVTRIGDLAFFACENLTSVVISATVTEIGYATFVCPSLDTVICLGSTPASLDVNTHVTSFVVSSDSHLMVPCGSSIVYTNSEWGEVFGNISEDCGFAGAEWYYEIQNENGSITYQHLEYAADTTVNNKDVQIIIRTNTLYDKGEYTEVTREYLYQENNVVYWWNPTLQEFTVLYNLEAQPGDSWVIKVGTDSITMHVDAVEQYEYEGRIYNMLRVSDEGNLFSGNIVCGIGHLTSFFPERLMTRGKGYRVEGMRCYWRDDELFFKYGDEDCDAVYKNYHFGLDEQEETAFAIYPNPTHGVLFVETQCFASQPPQTYRISNLMGQTLMTGNITAENQQIDVSNLPQGMYFISIGDTTQRFVMR